MYTLLSTKSLPHQISGLYIQFFVPSTPYHLDFECLVCHLNSWTSDIYSALKYLWGKSLILSVILFKPAEHVERGPSKAKIVWCDNE